LICSNGQALEVISFSYQNCDCFCGSNSQGDAAVCEDIAPLVEGPSTVLCLSGDGETLVVEPMPVLPGGVFTVKRASGGNLPESIDCTITGPDGTLLQQNSINTSGNVPLEIDDEFGAMQVESCDELSCIELLVYSIDITNSGSVSMEITVADLTLNDMTTSLVDDLLDTTVGPDETTVLEQRLEVDVCNGAQYNPSIQVEANTPNGGGCVVFADAASFSAAGESDFEEQAVPSIEMLTSPCIISADIVCEIINDGVVTGECDGMTNPAEITCDNGETPMALAFLNRGSSMLDVEVDCAGVTSTYAVGPGALFYAIDVDGNGATISISGGSSFELDTSCDGASTDLTLGSKYGDLELVGFETDGGWITSIYNVRLSYVVKNGSMSCVLDGANVDSPFQPAPFDAISNETILGDGAELVVFSDTTTIDAIQKYATDTTFTFTFDAKARGEMSDVECAAPATYTF
jgi:hypothetical protein